MMDNDNSVARSKKRDVIRIKIKMEPIPKGRPKMAMANGRVWTYTPTKTQKAQDYLSEYLARHSDKAFSCHIPVKLSAVFYRTKSKALPRQDVLPVRKPDLDNFLKLLVDAMNGVLIADDAQITTMLVRKRWTHNGYGYIIIRLEEDKE